jgi:PBP1b-binding outer membrane lipoprotein LpoB
MKNSYFAFFLGILLFSSCVPYKNTVYMQGEIQKRETEATVYKVQKNDILYVQISSSDESMQKIFSQSRQSVNNQNVSNQTLYFKG